MTIRPYAETAAMYMAAGWANPIPIHGDGGVLLGKRYPPSGYTGYDGANVSWPDMQAWIDGREGGHNIALRLPGDVVGIDVDDHDGKVGAQTIAKAEARLGPLPRAPRSTSRDPGGRSGIRVYRVPGGMNLKGAEKRFADAFGEHVDILRRDHRYVMSWPSVHPDTGDTYYWYGSEGERIEIPRPADLLDLPQAWVDFLVAPATATPSTSAAPGTPSLSPWDLPRQFTRAAATEFVRPAFERLRSASDGTINNKLNDAAVMIGHFVPTFWSRPEAERFLRVALGDTVYDGRTWRAETTIKSGLDARTWRAELVEDQPAVEPDDFEAIRERFPRLDWDALWADESTEDWIVEPLLPARRLVALYSPPKLGKSLLMLEIAVGVALGTSTLGFTPDRPRKVLYIDFENDPKSDIRERLMSMGYGPADLPNLVYLSFPTLSALDSAQGGAQLMAAVAAYECEVVVIDTVSRAVQGEENENDTWLAFYRHTGKALKAAGIALVRLDHTGKDESKGQRGGSAKSGDVDAVWRMSEVVKDKVYRLECEANRMPIMEKTLVIHRDVIPRLRHRVDAAGRYAAWSEPQKHALAILAASDLPLDAGRDRAKKVLAESGVKISNDLLSKVVKDRKESMNLSADLSGTGGEDQRSSDLSPQSADRSGQVAS